MVDLAHASPEVSPFETETASVVARVRASLSVMTRALGPKILRPTDLRRSLGVDGKLSWQLFNVMHEPDTMAAATHVPGAPSLSRLIRAAQAKGVSPEITDAVREAFSEFDRLIERHADDRTEFNLMASSVASTETAVAAEREWRKSAFRAERHIWGLSANVAAATAIARLNEDRKTTDECGLTVKRGLRRLRPDATLDVMGVVHYSAGGFQQPATPAPLDAQAVATWGVPILPAFCSQPIPPFRTWARPDGYHMVQVSSEDIGRQTSVDLAMGTVSRGCPLAQDLHGRPTYQFSLRVLWPARMAVMTLLIHRPTFGAVRPQARNFRMSVNDHQAGVALSSPQIPLREPVIRLAPGPAGWQEPAVERLDDLIGMALGKLGWNADEFDVFRLRIEYPVLHTVIRLEFPVEPLAS